MQPSMPNDPVMLDGDSILEFFDRFRLRGDRFRDVDDPTYSGRLSIDKKAVDDIVASWHDFAGRNVGNSREIALNLLHRFGRAEPRPISVSPGPGGYTKRGHSSRLGSIDKYKAANATFAFELWLLHIGCGDLAIEGEVRSLGVAVIAYLDLPDFQEDQLRALLEMFPYPLPGSG